MQSQSLHSQGWLNRPSTSISLSHRWVSPLKFVTFTFLSCLTFSLFTVSSFVCLLNGSLSPRKNNFWTVTLCLFVLLLCPLSCPPISHRRHELFVAGIPSEIKLLLRSTERECHLSFSLRKGIILPLFSPLDRFITGRLLPNQPSKNSTFSYSFFICFTHFFSLPHFSPLPLALTFE